MSVFLANDVFPMDPSDRNEAILIAEASVLQKHNCSYSGYMLIYHFSDLFRQIKNIRYLKFQVCIGFCPYDTLCLYEIFCL